MSRKALGLSMVLAGVLMAGTADANVLYFQSNENAGGGGTRTAFIFGGAGATGTVTGAGGTFSQDFTLGADGFASVSIGTGYELSGGSVTDEGFKITSDSALSGYFLSRQSATTDMTFLIDGDKLGTNYVVAGYHTLSGYPDQISVQATQDGTSVHFTPKGAPAFDVSLNAGQTYIYTANSEQTGAMVSSNLPIAVFSGDECTDIPLGAYACDHIVEQMPSVDQLSQSYILAQTPRTGTAGNRVRVVASADGTVVTKDGVDIATLNAGEFVEFSQTDGSTLTTNKPVLVAEYLISQSEAGGQLTDPAMTIVPGTDQWLKSYVFSAPSGADAFSSDYITLAIVSDALGSLLMGGSAPDTSAFSVIGGSGYSFGFLDVSSNEGVFNVTASNPFLLLASGADSYDSYFTYGGATFAPGASPPPTDNNPPPTTVPEPASLGLAGLGLAAIGLFRRRRKT